MREWAHPRYDRDLLLRWVRAARLVAQEEGRDEVDVHSMKVAAARLSELVAKKRGKPRTDGRPSVIPLDERGSVLPDSPHAQKTHAELTPPSDWLVRAIARHEAWLRSIAEGITRGR